MPEDEDHINDHDVADDTNELWRELVYKTAEMAVHFGLFIPVLGQYPDYVRENLEDEMRKVKEFLDGEIDFVQAFAEGLD